MDSTDTVRTKGKISGKTRKQKKKLHAALARDKRERRRIELQDATGDFETNFPAIELLRDPEGLVRGLMATVRKGTTPFAVRIMILNLISRIVYLHKLVVGELYPIFHKYLRPGQVDITVILAIIVQACHIRVPHEFLEGIMDVLFDKFVSDVSQPEVTAIGINTIYHMCVRCPYLMTAERLNLILQCRRMKHKAVMTACRSLLNLFREVNPSILTKKLRGRDGSALVRTDSFVPREFGAEDKTVTGLEGTDTLAAALKQREERERALNRQDLDDEEGSSSESDGDGEDEADSAKEGAKPQVVDGEGDAMAEGADELPLEQTRFLGDEDFVALDKIKRRNFVDTTLGSKKKLQNARKTRAIDAAEKERRRVLRGRGKKLRKLLAAGFTRVDIAEMLDALGGEGTAASVLGDAAGGRASAASQDDADEGEGEERDTSDDDGNDADDESSDMEDILDGDMSSSESDFDDGVVNPQDLLPIATGRKDKEERLAATVAGREGRSYGKDHSKGGGTTNKAKEKASKPWMTQRLKIKRRQRVSRHDKLRRQFVDDKQQRGKKAYMRK